MKRIFLTGASSGIGLAIARALIQNGHEVWGTSRRTERIPALLGMHAVALDLADRESLGATFRSASREAGEFDVVINNAGSGYFGRAESLSSEELARHFQVLVFGQIELMHLALEAMKGRPRGLVINVTSLASRLPVPFMAAYNAAKAALASYTMSMQLELGNGPVRLVDLQPADINTSFNDAVARAESNDPRVEQTWQAVDRNMKNAPPPDLVARAVLKLIAQDNPPPRITVGDTFQSGVAPLVFRLLPQRVRLWGLKKYYGI
ncbi:MAG: SDR family NAD(P)-dependent oxidoreductase [Chthoniobacterales bacterium]|nr:SDR family NAD(P)-dependent oxidoreductase [Chthoniobacterales bacterium]